MGEDAPVLQRALSASAPVTMVASLEEALDVAAAQAASGDTVLLSPACASFDQFVNYGARGDAFAAAVEALAR